MTIFIKLCTQTTPTISTATDKHQPFGFLLAIIITYQKNFSISVKSYRFLNIRSPKDNLTKR